jgi:hypothetical protein
MTCTRHVVATLRRCCRAFVTALAALAATLSTYGAELAPPHSAAGAAREACAQTEIGPASPGSALKSHDG